jgi:hypothetical protein
VRLHAFPSVITQPFELATLPSAPPKQYDVSGPVSSLDGAQPVDVVDVRVTSRSTLHLDEDYLEQVARLEQVTIRACSVLPNRQYIYDASPIAAARAPK